MIPIHLYGVEYRVACSGLDERESAFMATATSERLMKFSGERTVQYYVLYSGKTQARYDQEIEYQLENRKA